VTQNADVWPGRQVHVEWGRAGLEQATARGDGIVIVDVLSFSTLVALVTERGAVVRALAPDDIAALGGRDAVARRFEAYVAGEKRGDAEARVTLSPSSATRVEADDRLVVPSLNGGMLTSNAAAAPFAIVACLRNAVAVGRFVAAALRLGLVDRVTIVAAGEQWKQTYVGRERSRVATEDWLGAGAIAAECRARDASLSSEAELAARSYEASRHDLHAVVATSVTGRELIDIGFDSDVALAASVGVDGGVPWLQRDGFIARLPFGLRPATAADRPFLFTLKHATMSEYVVAAIGRWDEGVERRHFSPDLSRITVVSVEGRDVGMVEGRAEVDRFYLANIQVAPDLQSHGIGEAIVAFVAATAHARGRPLGLRVLKVNPRALKFYERLGLHVSGELPRHWAMELPPPT
jgi:2-phosphosulfolactate phosphatase